MKWSDLRPTADRLALKWKLDAYGNGSRHRPVVGRVVHELAHGLDLRMSPPPATMLIAVTLLVLPPELSDENELHSLAIQESWFARHGLPGSGTEVETVSAYLNAAKIKLPRAEVRARLRGAMASKATARFCDRLDELFGLRPVARRTRRVAVPEGQLAFGGSP